MVYRQMQPADAVQAMALWQQVFGDDEAFVQNSFDNFTGPDGMYIAEDDNIVLAILSAAQCTVGAHKGIYLYALATHPQSRGGGVMTGLMRHAEQAAAAQGRAFSVLIPADEGLYTYYRKRGYDYTLFLRHLALEQTGAAGADVRFQPPDAALLQALRARWLPGPAVAFGGSAWQAVVADLRDSGAQLAVARDGYAVFYPPQAGGLPLVAELAAPGEAQARAIADAVLRQTAAGRATATLPMTGPLAGQGTQQPAAVLKALDGRYAPPPDLYLRFAMDAP